MDWNVPTVHFSPPLALQAPPPILGRLQRRPEAVSVKKEWRLLLESSALSLVIF
jgi:hypothetical protein